MQTDISSNINTNSSPSQLKITDVRLVQVSTGGPILKIDTNQDIYGLGEVRDGASITYALMLKSRLLGQNPCQVDKIFRQIKQFGHHARQGGGVSAVEMALMDLTGKAYGIPCYQLAGGKFRNRIRCYSDTPVLNDPVEMGQKLIERIQRGFTFLKMDVGIDHLRNISGTLSAPTGHLDDSNLMHPFTSIRITDKGIDILADYVGTVRQIIGYEVPLALDHFGHIGVDDCIRLAQELDQYNLAWLEDMIPWQFTEQYVRLSNACTTPICTGEDIYCKEEFIKLFQAQAISVAHPDIASSGGILETKKIGDLAQEYGISMALHMAGTPICAMASVHCAAATENFLVLENHSVDTPWWDELVIGLPNPIIEDGYIRVPETPGLGIELNETVIKEHLHPSRKAYFPSTPEWNEERSHDRLWS